MTFSMRMRQMFLFFVAITLFAGGAAHAAQPDSGNVRQKVMKCGENCTIKLRLADHSKVKGQVAAIHDDSVEVSTVAGKIPITVPFAQIETISSRTSLGSRFKMGPCTGPITLAIASPFILVGALFGH